MASDRLKEISDYVDSNFIKRNNKHANTVRCLSKLNNLTGKLKTSLVLEKPKDLLVNETNSEENIISNQIIYKNNTDSKFIRLMLETERKLYFKFKYSCNPENMQFKTLFLTFIYSLYKKSGCSSELKKLADYNISYFDNIDEYMLDTYGKDQRKYINELMKKFNKIPINDDYNNLKSIHHNIFINDIEIKHLIKIIEKNPNKIYPIEKFTNYKKILNNFRNYICSLADKLSIYINSLNTDIITIFDKDNNVSVDIKNYKLNMINVCINKINKIFKLVNRFNIPELMIYNKLVEIKSNNKNQLCRILCIFNNYNLPISRNDRNQLVADFLIISQINDRIRFSIIEYDGPSHYNSNYYQFNKNSILCDIVKNNFCKINNIDLLRIKDTNNTFLDSVSEFINMIFNNDKCIINTPTYEEYINIYNTVPNTNDII